MKRCNWVNLNNPAYVDYHDHEWGIPCHDDKKLYELFILECFQAGLSWECVLNKRENFRNAYDQFDIDKVIVYDETEINRLLSDPGIIRNKLKIQASIINSQIFKSIQQEFGTFNQYLYQYTDGKVLYEAYTIRTSSELSDLISKNLKKRGMKFVGSTTIYSFLQACGLIYAHGPECDLHCRK